MKYGEHDEVKGKRGLVHEYLGMTFWFGIGVVQIDMTNYVGGMLEEFPIKFNKKDKKVSTPARVDIFKEDTSKKLGEK